jgi:hypothetical protein
MRTLEGGGCQGIEYDMLPQSIEQPARQSTLTASTSSRGPAVSQCAQCTVMISYATPGFSATGLCIPLWAFVQPAGFCTTF